MRYLIILCLLIAGCVRNIPVEPSLQFEEKSIIIIHKHKWDYDTGKCWICGASFSPIRIKAKATRLKDSKHALIQAIMLESGLSEPEATILWEKYKRSDIKGLAAYLIKVNPYNKIDRVYIDLVERIKVRTKILKRTK